MEVDSAAIVSVSPPEAQHAVEAEDGREAPVGQRQRGPQGRKARAKEEASLLKEYKEEEQRVKSDASQWHCTLCRQLAPPTLHDGEEGKKSAQSDSGDSSDSAKGDDEDQLLSCEGGCLRSFHPACLLRAGIFRDSGALKEVLQSDDPWVCEQCRPTGSHACVICSGGASPTYCLRHFSGMGAASGSGGDGSDCTCGHPSSTNGNATHKHYEPVMEWGRPESISSPAFLFLHLRRLWDHRQRVVFGLPADEGLPSLPHFTDDSGAWLDNAVAEDGVDGNLSEDRGELYGPNDRGNGDASRRKYAGLVMVAKRLAEYLRLTRGGFIAPDNNNSNGSGKLVAMRALCAGGFDIAGKDVEALLELSLNNDSDSKDTSEGSEVDFPVAAVAASLAQFFPPLSTNPSSSSASSSASSSSASSAGVAVGSNNSPSSDDGWFEAALTEGLRRWRARQQGIQDADMSSEQLAAAGAAGTDEGTSSNGHDSKGKRARFSSRSLANLSNDYWLKGDSGARIKAKLEAQARGTVDAETMLEQAATRVQPESIFSFVDGDSAAASEGGKKKGKKDSENGSDASVWPSGAKLTQAQREVLAAIEQQLMKLSPPTLSDSSSGSSADPSSALSLLPWLSSASSSASSEELSLATRKRAIVAAIDAFLRNGAGSADSSLSMSVSIQAGGVARGGTVTNVSSTTNGVAALRALFNAAFPPTADSAAVGASANQFFDGVDPRYLSRLVLPAPISTVSFPFNVAGCPASLLGAAWKGTKRCFRPECGTYSHWSCLRRMEDIAVMDAATRRCRAHNMALEKAKEALDSHNNNDNNAASKTGKKGSAVVIKARSLPLPTYVQAKDVATARKPAIAAAGSGVASAASSAAGGASAGASNGGVDYLDAWLSEIDSLMRYCLRAQAAAHASQLSEWVTMDRARREQMAPEIRRRLQQLHGNGSDGDIDNIDDYLPRITPIPAPPKGLDAIKKAGGVSPAASALCGQLMGNDSDSNGSSAVLWYPDVLRAFEVAINGGWDRLSSTGTGDAPQSFPLFDTIAVKWALPGYLPPLRELPAAALSSEHASAPVPEPVALPPPVDTAAALKAAADAMLETALAAAPPLSLALPGLPTLPGAASQPASKKQAAAGRKPAQPAPSASSAIITGASAALSSSMPPAPAPFLLSFSEWQWVDEGSVNAPTNSFSADVFFSSYTVTVASSTTTTTRTVRIQHRYQSARGLIEIPVPSFASPRLESGYYDYQLPAGNHKQQGRQAQGPGQGQKVSLQILPAPQVRSLFPLPSKGVRALNPATDPMRGCEPIWLSPAGLSSEHFCPGHACDACEVPAQGSAVNTLGLHWDKDIDMDEAVVVHLPLKSIAAATETSADAQVASSAEAAPAAGVKEGQQQATTIKSRGRASDSSTTNAAAASATSSTSSAKTGTGGAAAASGLARARSSRSSGAPLIDPLALIVSTGATDPFFEGFDGGVAAGGSSSSSSSITRTHTVTAASATTTGATDGSLSAYPAASPSSSSSSSSLPATASVPDAAFSALMKPIAVTVTSVASAPASMTASEWLQKTSSASSADAEADRSSHDATAAAIRAGRMAAVGFASHAKGSRKAAVVDCVASALGTLNELSKASGPNSASTSASAMEEVAPQAPSEPLDEVVNVPDQQEEDGSSGAQAEEVVGAKRSRGRPKGSVSGELHIPSTPSSSSSFSSSVQQRGGRKSRGASDGWTWTAETAAGPTCNVQSPDPTLGAGLCLSLDVSRHLYVHAAIIAASTATLSRVSSSNAQGFNALIAQAYRAVASGGSEARDKYLLESLRCASRAEKAKAQLSGFLLEPATAASALPTSAAWLHAASAVTEGHKVAASLLRQYGPGCLVVASSRDKATALLSSDRHEEAAAGDIVPPPAKRQRREQADEGSAPQAQGSSVAHLLFAAIGARTTVPATSPASAYIPLAKAIVESLQHKPTLLPVVSSRVAVMNGIMKPQKASQEVRRCLDCARAYHDIKRCRPATAAVNPYALLCHRHCTNPLPGEGSEEAQEHLAELGLSREALLTLARDSSSSSSGAADDEDDLIAAAAAAAAAKASGQSSVAPGGAQALLAAASAGGFASGLLLALLQKPAPKVKGAAAASGGMFDSRTLVAAGKGLLAKFGKAKAQLQKEPVPAVMAPDDPRHFRLWASWAAELDTRMPVWTRISKNVYVTKVKPQREDEDTDLCMCSRTSKTLAADGKTRLCDDDCINRSLRVECRGGASNEGGGGAGGGSAKNDRCNCSVGPNCGNRALQLRQLPALDLIPTPGKGWGVRAGADIAEGAFIIEYVGEIIDERMQEERLERCKEEGETHYYLMEIDSNQIIDARVKSNLARFINHSCEPNAELQRWSVDGYTRIGIFALRDIAKGEEIAYDYQWFTSERTPCACGAPKCRGFLGANVAKEEEEKRREQEEKNKKKQASSTSSAPKKKPSSGAGASAKPKKQASAAPSVAETATGTASPESLSVSGT